MDPRVELAMNEQVVKNNLCNQFKFIKSKTPFDVSFVVYMLLQF